MTLRIARGMPGGAHHRKCMMQTQGRMQSTAGVCELMRPCSGTVLERLSRAPRHVQYCARKARPTPPPSVGRKNSPPDGNGICLRPWHSARGDRRPRQRGWRGTPHVQTPRPGCSPNFHCSLSPVRLSQPAHARMHRGYNLGACCHLSAIISIISCPLVPLSVLATFRMLTILYNFGTLQDHEHPDLQERHCFTCHLL